MKILSRLRKKIETLLSVADNFGLKFIKAVSRRGLAVKDHPQLDSFQYLPATIVKGAWLRKLLEVGIIHGTRDGFKKFPKTLK
ncbi:MAG TPA: hypothetical protein ENI32_02725 [Candidatus Syntrophoarchaeum butanivorans]|uniref:Uncharacterized protein n=1 Tax=Candidatus Syntropharchaeum butanivorans TaxID=1839936 RepID=A0A7J2S098_9EURY|nr:hypothetical protein [Candidatus Syntrophoarchaeum butanivorans]